jgi:arylsulfatase A-like enzyme
MVPGEAERGAEAMTHRPRRCPAAALLLAACSAADPVVLPDVPPNVLVVVIDEMGVDKLGAYGFPEAPSTPVIDGLAAEGVRFDAAYVTPVCAVTRGALLTGQMPRRTGFGANVLRGGGLVLDPSLPSVADVVKTADPPYATEAIGKWHLADFGLPETFDHALRMGFDHHHGTVGNIAHTSTDERGSYDRWERVVDGEPEMVDGYATSMLVDDALDRIDGLVDPWLLWVAFHGAHQPLHVPPSDLTPSDPPVETDADRFDAMIESVDTAIGQILDGMHPTIRERTTVVVIGDNGTIRPAIRPPLDSERHKGSVYEGGVRVPLVVAGPGVTAPGTVSDALVHAVDLLPTVAALARVDLDTALPDVRLDGASLLPALAGEPGHRDVVWTELFAPDVFDKRMIRAANHKLIRIEGEPDRFFMLDPLAFDEGDDLLVQGLTPDEQAAYEALGDALEERTAAAAAGL